MSKFVKRNFVGGINSQTDPSKVDPTSQYYLGVNVRTRRNIAEPVAAPLEITPPITGHIQGVYTFDTTLLLFVGGKAYYSTDEGANWTQVGSLQMDVDVDEIDCCLVPASSVNFVRTAPTSTTQTDNEVVFGNVINASPQCLIVMDGITQPWIIFPDSTARITQNYNDWTSTNPEYVPIGRFPLYYDGILYCVGRDLTGRLTQIYRSVSGRPLDFVILLNSAGNKISSVESEGGAPVLANRVSYSNVTCMAVLNTIQNAFFVATDDASWIVQPDYTTTIAGEPQFNNVFLFAVGAVNKNCVTSVLGDAVVLGKAGVRSFNGVQQFRWDGKNAPFSAAVNNFISTSIQTVASCASYDNYAVFALNTAFGPGVLIYDELLQCFVSIDLYKNVGFVRQFARVYSGTTERLYGYTSENKLLKFFTGADQTAAMYLCDFTPNETFGAHRVTSSDVVMSDAQSTGYVEVVAYSDRTPYFSGAQFIDDAYDTVVTPFIPPFPGPINSGANAQYTFDFTAQTPNGWRATAGVIWNAKASLVEMSINLAESDTEANAPMTASAPIDNTELILIGNDGLVTDSRTNVNLNIRAILFDRVLNAGNIAYTSGTASDITTNTEPAWEQVRVAGKFLGVHGAVDLDTVNGEPLYQWLRQGAAHYTRHVIGTFVEVFCITAGYNSAGTQVEPANLDGATIELSTQMQWLKANLASSTAVHKIVLWFDPPYTSNGTVTPRLVDIPIYAWGATLLVCGGGGIYERLIQSTGLSQLNIGTGGASIYTGDLTIVDESRATAQVAGFVKLSLSPLRVVGQFVSEGGDILDTFVL